jgi:sulfite oxidase
VQKSGKQPGLIVWERDPFNAETPLGLLRQSFVTPTGLFYVRSHGTVPEVNADGFRLGVFGLVERTLSLSLAEVREGFPSYGASIPIEKALSPEVLLAYEMNGEPLPPEHGFPLRVVVPGYIGARGVKWLSSIELREAPSDNHYQAGVYKLFPPNVSSETADLSGGLMLGEVPVNAAICVPQDGEDLPAGPVAVRGYAVAGGGRRVERVDVSSDAGRTWTQAELLEAEEYLWAWRFWEARLKLRPGPYRIVARAFDSAADTQPEDAGGIWNFKGYANNAWHRVEVNVR